MPVLVILFCAVAFGVFALSLRLGTRLAKIRDAGWGRVLAASALIWAAALVLNLSVRAMGSSGLLPEALAMTAGLILQVVATLLILRAVLRTDLRRALAAWLATLAGSAVIVALLVLLVNPYLFQAFTSPSNAMAPTLLGRHHVVACPRCGGPAYFSPDPTRPPAGLPPELAICGRCLQVSAVADIPDEIHPPDRFLVDRLSSPRRWDVVVYLSPEDPTRRYVHRLVGLPGETVTIRDGGVWIDGHRQVSPRPIAPLAYFPLPGLGPDEQPPERSWRLGPDEYFVLGDFARDPGTPGPGPGAPPGTRSSPCRGRTSRAW